VTRIRWSPEAAADLRGIVDQVAIDNPNQSSAIARKIFDHVRMLSRFPRLGRPGRRPGARELVIPGLPYIAVYRLKGGVVNVGRLFHGAQRQP
jgi:plasmid stabilization system protein ParE